MKTYIAVLSTVLALSLPLLARDKTDVVIMKNGDRLTCQIKGLDGGTLYVALDYVDGTVSVDWSKVARLASTQAFVVRTQDGSTYRGRLRTAETLGDRPVRIEVLGQNAVLEQSRITSMVEISEKFWQRFSGDIGVGVVHSKGNQSTQYDLNSQVAYIRELWSAQASVKSGLASSSGVETSTRNSITLGARHRLPWNQWFYSGLGVFLQSSEQQITLQTTAGGGIGRALKNTNRVSISVLGGAAWQNTKYGQSTVAVGNQNTAEALIFAETRLFRFSKSNLRATAVLLPSVSDPGRLRFNTDATGYIKIVGNLKWTLSFYGNWDNRPPPGHSGSDYGSSSGISWTFGLK